MKGVALVETTASQSTSRFHRRVIYTQTLRFLSIKGVDGLDVLSPRVLAPLSSFSYEAEGRSIVVFSKLAIFTGPDRCPGSDFVYK